MPENPLIEDLIAARANYEQARAAFLASDSTVDYIRLADASRKMYDAEDAVLAAGTEG